jgi:putative sterol carrier protein
MASPTEEFFDELGRRGYEPLLAKVTGSVRFEMVQGLCTEPWYVRVDKGDVRVSRETVEADAVLRADRELFDRIAAGEVSLTPRVLRGEAAIEGDGSLIVALERVLPAPNPPVRFGRARS